MPHRALSLNRGNVRWRSRTLPGELLDRTICGVLRNGRWRSQGFHLERGGVSDARMLPQDPATPVGFADGGVEVLSCHALLVTGRSGRSCECLGCPSVIYRSAVDRDGGLDPLLFDGGRFVLTPVGILWTNWSHSYDDVDHSMNFYADDVYHGPMTTAQVDGAFFFDVGINGTLPSGEEFAILHLFDSDIVFDDVFVFLGTGPELYVYCSTRFHDDAVFDDYFCVALTFRFFILDLGVQPIGWGVSFGCGSLCLIPGQSYQTHGVTDSHAYSDSLVYSWDTGSSASCAPDATDRCMRGTIGRGCGGTPNSHPRRITPSDPSSQAAAHCTPMKFLNDIESALAWVFNFFLDDVKRGPPSPPRSALSPRSC